MKNILFTGGTGFIGKNVLPTLSKRFNVSSPDRAELNLLDTVEIQNYLSINSFDVIIHCANPNPVKNSADDSSDTMFEFSLRMFMNFAEANKLYGKLIYTGSGAEYDKTMDIISVQEKDCFRSLPKDSYGLAKYIMNTIADKSSKIFNLCVFGCYGPYDYHTKFITHCINCCLDKKPITIRQECLFDFLHVYDLATMMCWMIENDMQHHMYNASGGDPVLLSQIATEVKQQMNVDVPITILNKGMNKEYTANGNRFFNESGIKHFYSIKDGISNQIEWQTKGQIQI